MKKKAIILTILVLILGLAIFLYHIQSERYSPNKIIEIESFHHQSRHLKYGDSLNILMWNISYGGMPQQMDFFYSGGTRIRVDKKTAQNNFHEILKRISNYKDSIDIFLFHKVDTASKRSYYMHQYQQIQHILPEYESAFCINFSNPYIPVPLDKPIGQLHSGMLNMSKIHADSYQRIALDSKEYYWPKKLFTAQKCISSSSFPIGQTHLYILNVHLSSYDYQGEIRLSQLKEIEKLADSLYKANNYVIVAGGWNMNPPGFKKYRISYGYKGKPTYPEIDSAIYFSGWKFEYDTKIPTSRSLKESYRHSAINTTIKDFFICSPNINILMTNTTDQQFLLSDHQAVLLQILLLPNYEK